MSEKQRTQGVKYEHYLLLIRGCRVKGARLQGKHTLVIYVIISTAQLKYTLLTELHDDT